MKTLQKVAITTAITITLSGCAELQQVAQEALEQSTNLPVTNSDVAAGLRQALTKGANNATNKLAAANGYLKDETVKILLPEEAGIITENIKKVPGGEKTGGGGHHKY